MKIIFIPGNGGSSTTDYWFGYVKTKFEKLGITVIAAQFPDPNLARAAYWLPFIEKLGADENTILIGHSSGAVAAMRFAETHKILGSVLVGVCYTDLGEESERVSLYYDHPWDWEAIRKNQEWIIEFASTDDPFIPIDEPRYIHEKLGTEYYEYTDQGHFQHKERFPELLKAIKNKTGGL